MEIRKHIRLSLTAKLLLLFYLLLLISNSIYRHYSGITPKQFVSHSDMEGYYQYLPHFFLKDWEEMDQMRWAKPFNEDKKLNVFTSGVAIMVTPFFLIAHVISKFLELESNGYNPVYYMSVLFAAIFYVFIGLFFLYKSLLRSFSKHASLLTTILIFFATNLFYYTVMKPGMSHAYSFTLISLYIYNVPAFYDKPGVKSSLYVILPLALAVLIRPTTIIAGIFFLLYQVYSLKDLSNRFLILFRHWPLLVLMFATALIIFFPQMAYWKYVTGKWFFYSYQQEGFSNALSPEINTVLFGARNGWFIYTPLMILATGGLIYLAVKRRYSSPAILLLMIIIIYVNASWWLPTFSTSAGYRTLIAYYPLMAIPLSFVIQQGTERKKAIKTTLYIILIFFVVYNLLFSFKYSGYLWWNEDWQWSHFKSLVRF